MHVWHRISRFLLDGWSERKAHLHFPIKGFYFDKSTNYESLMLEVETEELGAGLAWIVPLPYIRASIDEYAAVIETPIASPEDDLFAVVHSQGLGFGRGSAATFDGVRGGTEQARDESSTNRDVDVLTIGSTSDFQHRICR